MTFLLKFQSQGPDAGPRWRMVWMVASRSGTSRALSVRKASRSRSSSDGSFMGSLLRRPGHGPGRQPLVSRRFALPRVAKIEAPQFFPAAGQARLHGRDRGTLQIRDFFHGESFDVVQHDGLALVRLEPRQSAGRALRTPALLFPQGPVFPDRLVATAERVLDRQPFAAWSPHA